VLRQVPISLGVCPVSLLPRKCEWLDDSRMSHTAVHSIVRSPYDFKVKPLRFQVHLQYHESGLHTISRSSLYDFRFTSNTMSQVSIRFRGQAFTISGLHPRQCQWFLWASFLMLNCICLCFVSVWIFRARFLMPNCVGLRAELLLAMLALWLFVSVRVLRARFLMPNYIGLAAIFCLAKLAGYLCFVSVWVFRATLLMLTCMARLGEFLLAMLALWLFVSVRVLRARFLMLDYVGLIKEFLLAMLALSLFVSVRVLRALFLMPNYIGLDVFLVAMLAL
jgi:hypothetical protein